MSAVTQADIAGVCVLLKRLRTGEMNLIPSLATAEPRDPNGNSEAMLQRVEDLLNAQLRRMDAPLGDGGSAFPYHLNDGMTLRDYFIAHAPAEPQQWFTPTHPEPVKPPYPEDLSEADLQEHREYNADALEIEQITNPQLAGYLRSRIFYEQQCSDWRCDFEKQRYLQWPAAWADAMLKARAA